MDGLVNKLREVESILTTEGHSFQEYMQAVSDVSSIHDEMGKDFRRYGRIIERSFDVLQIASFDRIKYDEPLIELAAIIPASFYIAKAMLGNEEPRKAVVSAVVESFCSHIFHLRKFEDGAQLHGLISALNRHGLHAELREFIDTLLSADPSTHGAEIADAIGRSLYECTDVNEDIKAIKAILLEKEDVMVNRPWFWSSTSGWEMESAIKLYECGFEKAARIIMAEAMRHGKALDLLKMESVSGVKVGNSDALFMIKQSRSNAVLHYLLRSQQLSVPLDLLQEHSFRASDVSEAILRPSDKYPIQFSRYFEFIENALAGFDDINEFFSLYDFVIRTENPDIPDGFHQKVITAQIFKNKDKLKNIDIITCAIYKGAIAYNYLESQSILDEILVSNLVKYSTLAILSIAKNDYFWSAFSEEAKVAAFNELASNNREATSNRFVSAFPRSLVMKVPAMRRVLLQSDMGLED